MRTVSARVQGATFELSGEELVTPMLCAFLHWCRRLHPCRLQRTPASRPQVEWGIDLQTEHERYLTEEVFKAPIIVYNYPKDIKAFYMRLNDDGKTVAAMDVLVPKVGAWLRCWHLNA